MKIELSKKQYENLLKLVYLGEWVINAHKTDDRMEKYEDISSYIFSYAKKFGFGRYCDDESVGDGKYYPTRLFEEKTGVDQFHDEYDEEIFWEELVDKMGQLDFHRKYSKKEIKKMDKKEHFIKLYECIDKWGEETNKNGLDRLGIIK